MSGSNRDGFDLVEGEVIISPKIREVISVLEAEGKASVTLTREQLGSGCYSTLSAVLGEWRKERAKAESTARTLEAELTELRVAEPSLASASGIRLYRTNGRFYLESLPYPGLPIFLTFRFGVLS